MFAHCCKPYKRRAYSSRASLTPRFPVTMSCSKLTATKFIDVPPQVAEIFWLIVFGVSKEKFRAVEVATEGKWRVQSIRFNRMNLARIRRASGQSPYDQVWFKVFEAMALEKLKKYSESFSCFQEAFLIAQRSDPSSAFEIALAFSLIASKGFRYAFVHMNLRQARHPGQIRHGSKISGVWSLEPHLGQNLVF